MLRDRTVRLLLAAAAVSVLGDSAAMVALVLRAHAGERGPWAVSVLLLAFALPVVLTMGPAGALADRAYPRRVLVATALVQTGAALGLAVVSGVVATVVLVHVLQTAFALGHPTWSAIVPRLVPPGGAGRVVALQQSLRGVAGPAGAAVGGVLVEWHGPSTALVLDALTFLGLTAVALTLPRAARPRPRPGGAARRWTASILPGDGLRELRTDRVLLVLVLSLLPMIVALESVNVAEVFLVRDVLGASAAQYGLAEAVTGGSAVLGAVLGGSLTRRASRTRAVLGGVGLLGLVQVGQGLAPGLLVYLVLGAGLGLVLGLVNALVVALVLDELAADHRGSVLALVGGLSRAASALALVAGGVVTAVAGPRTLYVVAGVTGVLVALVAAWFVHRSMDRGSTARVSTDAVAATTLEA